MCGIYGYIGDNSASEIIMDGLKRLDYRGYDSWGVGLYSKNKIVVTKKAGKFEENDIKKKLPSSTIGIGHTRWATHGAVTQINAHPHTSTDGSFTLAQNGIVENYEELKKTLSKKKYPFISQTDTEVIVRLIEDKKKTGLDMITAVRAAFKELKGRNTIVVLTSDNEIIAARNGSPLVVGVNKTKKEVFLSSDVLSFSPYVEKVLLIENGQMVYTNKTALELYDINSGKKQPYTLEPVTIQSGKVDKEGYEHFMLKEISETPFVIQQVINADVKTYTAFIQAIKKAAVVYTIGSGSAGIAAAQMAFYLREHANVNAISLVGADAQEYFHLFKQSDIIIAPSQSGETADVLEVLEVAKKKNMKIATYVNMPGSMMTRIADYKFMANAGPEICVMSTKVFTSQIVWGYLVSKMAQGKYEEGLASLQQLANAVRDYLINQPSQAYLKDLVEFLIPKHDIFLLGKYQNFQIIREGMIKMIEGTYKHAHALPAGDLKHYAITLMEAGVPVVAALSNDMAKSDVINAISQIKARGAQVIGLGSVHHESFDYHMEVPDTGETSAIMNLLPLQLLAYYLAKKLGNNIDKPRHIAKSVTVK